MRHLAWVLFVVSACTDFQEIDRGVCGNGLLEPGEDCDSTAASCVSCSVACASAADCPTSEYACGVDGLCHAPGGVLDQPQTAGTFRADELRVTDINHDGIGDAFGVTKTSVVVRDGDPSAQLDQLTSFVTPTQTGAAAFGDLDRDGSIDVTLTTPDGLVSFVSTYGELIPLAVPERLIAQDTSNPLDLRKMYYLGTNILAALVVDPSNDNAVLVSIDANAPNPAPQFIAPCFARLGTFKAASLDTIDVYNVTKRNDTKIDAVITVAGGTGASRKYCVMSVHRDPPNLITGAVPAIQYTDITIPALGTPAAKTVLADIDLDTDPCPGLLTSDAGLAATVYWDGAMQGGKCILSPQSASSPQNPITLPAIPAPATATLLGRVPVDPQVAFIASDAVITSEGVYPLFFGYYFFSVYHTTRKISQFGTGDFNGDGAVEVAFAAEGEEDLDVLFRDANMAGFNLYRLDTQSTVSTLQTGDFDGDNVDDIVYTEVYDGHDTVQVCWGTHDRPLPPQVVGSFSSVLSIDRISIKDSVDALGVAEDLVVFQPPLAGSTTKRVTVLHGSPQRTLLSYFDPRKDSVRKETLFRGAVIGNFTSDAGATQYTDLFAIAPVAADSTTGDKSLVRAWRVPGTTEGLDGTQTDPMTMQGLSDCSLNVSSSPGALCLDLARYVAFPTAADHDVIIGIDKVGHALMADPWAGSTVASTVLASLAPLIPANTVAKSLYASDLDGDGSTDLLVAFAPTPNSGVKGAIVRCTMANGIPQICEDIAPAIVDAASNAGIPVDQCYDATIAKLTYRDVATTPDPSSDLLVACVGDGTSIFRVHTSGSTLDIERVATRGKVVTSIRGGDVNGDQLDDLVLLEGDVVSNLVVYPQCTSRDRACIGGGR